MTFKSTIDTRDACPAALSEAELNKVTGGMIKKKDRNAPPRFLTPVAAAILSTTGGPSTRSSWVPSKSRTRQAKRARCDLAAGFFRYAFVERGGRRPGMIWPQGLTSASSGPRHPRGHCPKGNPSSWVVIGEAHAYSRQARMIDIAMPHTDAPYRVMASLPHGSGVAIGHPASRPVRPARPEGGHRQRDDACDIAEFAENGGRAAAAAHVRWRELLCVSAFTLVSLRYADGQFRSRVETITVTGETPIVDVQSARAQQMVSKDVFAAIPTSRRRRHSGPIPGMAAAADVGGSTVGGAGAGKSTAAAGSIRARIVTACTTAVQRRRRRGGGNGERRRRAGDRAQHLGRPGRSGNRRRAVNLIPREGGNTFSGTSSSTARTARCRAATSRRR